MGLIGDIIGGALKVGGAIYGGISATQSAKQQQENIANQREKNQNWFDRRYNEDATQRADAQALLTMTEDNIRNRNRQAAGAAAVMGGTNESVAAAKAANNQAIANTVSAINADAANRKDRIEAIYNQNEEGYVNQLNEIEANKQQNIANAVMQNADAASSIIDAFSPAGGNVTKETESKS